MLYSYSRYWTGPTIELTILDKILGARAVFAHAHAPETRKCLVILPLPLSNVVKHEKTIPLIADYFATL